MRYLFPRRTAAVRTGAAAAALLFAVPITAEAQLRVATWNISNYTPTSTDRSDALKTAIYGAFDGRSMTPDVFMTQEFTAAGSVNNFLNVLNTAPNSPGDWAAAPFVDGPDTDSAFFYRTSKLSFGGQSTVIAGDISPGTTQPPRNVQRYDVSLKGYAITSPNLALYSVHMKAGDAGTDEARRRSEADAIRANAASLPATTQFLVGGDFNVDRSSDDGYDRLVQSQANNAGRFVDPIKTPGTWTETSAMRYVHTQDPSGAGGMDDRYDFILLGSGLTDRKGFEYVGDATAAYSTSTWNDPNHSYRVWGNDGGSYNVQLRTAGNEMVGPTVAQALKTASTTNGGHLPIFLDLEAPAELAAGTSTINFGDVQQGSDPSIAFDVFNGVDPSIWSIEGVNELSYAMRTIGGDFSVPIDQFTDAAGGPVNSHLVTLDASAMGLKTGTIELFADGVLAHSIALQANVVPEPAGVALVGVAALGLLRRRRRA